MIFSLEELLITFGYFALLGFIFAESGLFFGFFLPGDSLLFTSGILAAKGILDIYLIIPATIVCAFLGDQVGCWTEEVIISNGSKVARENAASAYQPCDSVLGVANG